MSLYSTPVKQHLDEGSTPCSANSVYFTPQAAFSFTPENRNTTKVRENLKILKFNIYNDDLYLEENSSNSSNSPIDNKENISWLHHRYTGNEKCKKIAASSTPSYHSPLKTISNYVNNDKLFEESDEKLLNAPPTKSNFQSNRRAESSANPISIKSKKTRYAFLSSLRIGKAKSRSDSNVRKVSKLLVNASVQTDNDYKLLADDTTLKRIQMSKADFLSGLCSDVDDGEKLQEDTEKCYRTNEIHVEFVASTAKATDDSRVPLLLEKANKKRKWRFIKPSKFGISPVKRLFTKSTTYLTSLTRSIFKQLPVHRFRSLWIRNESRIPIEDSTSLHSNELQKNVCSHCVENIVSKEEFLSKMSSLESDLKEIKKLLQNGYENHKPNISNPISIPPPPPPPPPPPIPSDNFMCGQQNSGILKRKANLITPENGDHARKKPAIKQEKTQFAITVEDIKSVKLRRTPGSSLIMKNAKEDGSSKVGGDDLLRSVKLKRLQKNRSGLRDNLNLESILNSPGKEKKNGEQTPKIGRKGLYGNRTIRKEWLESPVRKRFNDGNNSTIYCDTELES